MTHACDRVVVRQMMDEMFDPEGQLVKWSLKDGGAALLTVAMCTEHCACRGLAIAFLAKVEQAIGKGRS